MKAGSTLSLRGHELEANRHMHFYRSTSNPCLYTREHFCHVHTLVIYSLLSPSSFTLMGLAVKTHDTFQIEGYV